MKCLQTIFFDLTLLHSERPKLYTILAFLGAIGLRGLSEISVLEVRRVCCNIMVPLPISAEHPIKGIA